MNHQAIIYELQRHQKVFETMLSNIPEACYSWKPAPEKWCLLEIVCHLYDEEREDFRARVRHILEQPAASMPSIDPQGWVAARKYMEQDYETKLRSFLQERNASIKWLQSLAAPVWTNVYQHPTLGSMSAEMILANWLAHDYLHIRQITGVKFQYLQHSSSQSLNYAGNW
jgi:hypothetical protein